MAAVLTESSSAPANTPAQREIRALTAVARSLGCAVVQLPERVDSDDDAESAFDWTRPADERTLAIGVGHIPTAQAYRAVYEAAARRNYVLPNTPEQSLEATEFARFYPRLTGLTPLSEVVTNEAEAVTAARRLGFPLFCPRSREFRFFVLGGEVIGHGFYWDDKCDGSALDADEQRKISRLAREAA